MTSVNDTRIPRSSGVLVHPTSLPAVPGSVDFGIGDVGPMARAWIDWLARARQSWWQILPLGPTGGSNSPYQSYSAFAGNPNLISLEMLIRDGLLSSAEIPSTHFPPNRVDFGSVIPLKERRFDSAFERWRASSLPGLRERFERFAHENADWLDEFALFMAIKQQQGGKWTEWPDPLRLREPAAIAKARIDLADRIERIRFRQFLFFEQWRELREHARQRGIKLIGDIPIFVSGDSADVWANPQLFLLDVDRRQPVQAGVPPDYFTEDGQLWGNPLYDWAEAKRTGYAWWIKRVQMALSLVDLVRIDHFRGFVNAWHVPIADETAKNGKWVPGPGAELFEVLRRQLGGLPLIAEDLGMITKDVLELRDQLGLPGMRVLQFAFGNDPANFHLPHHHTANSVVYTGTHDNDTTRGWYATLSEWEKDHVRRYLARDGRDIGWDLIRTAWSSVADLAIVPLQDLLDLGSEARMNVPGVPKGNWIWRASPGTIRDDILHRIADLTQLYGRVK